MWLIETKHRLYVVRQPIMFPPKDLLDALCMSNDGFLVASNKVHYFK